MNSRRKKVSILMSVYNGSRYLAESIDSILRQTFSDFEFIIIDDCSTDDSWTILSAYAEVDSRIVLYRNDQNLGLTKSLNKGLRAAKGIYIARQDHDDVSLPHRLSEQVEFLEHNPQAVFVSSNIEIIDANGQPLGIIDRACTPTLVKWYLLFYNHIAGHSQVMFRKNPALNLGGYNENYQYVQDYEFWCRLSAVGQFYILPKTHVQQRFHDGSISASKKEAQKNYVLERVGINLEPIIGYRLNPQKTLLLFNFWADPSMVCQFKEVHVLLTEICQAYFKESCRQELDGNLILEIQKVVAKNFLKISILTSFRKGLKQKISALRYAAVWHFQGTLIYSFRHYFKKSTEMFRDFSIT
ncbi:MAG: glycosyltransferase [Cyanothece sp. SIO1E1]|nr:glycosyltransferase [Cyanothece sp. SIO1E1]